MNLGSRRGLGTLHPESNCGTLKRLCDDIRLVQRARELEPMP